jgi:3'-phosphoadenosine 5'-phosphosulfate sulfotransferase (PAPS reductase)/FAD synthetase
LNNEDFNKLPSNKEIYESFLVANKKINDPSYDNIGCSISGGSDSDIMLDICNRVNEDAYIHYVFFDTGLEYQATKDHLTYLENKYNITIEHKKAKKSIPTCNKEYGQPFLSKYVSEFMSRLQRHNFQWEDESYDQLIKRYPKCKSALQWWCNDKGSESHFNITQNKYLKEFIIANPPDFKISNKCCHFAKKLVAKEFKDENEIDLSLVGVRKAEGGARSTAYKNCFTSNNDKSDEYRPIFWYKNETKEIYDKHFNIVHSACYSKYGLKRTGCAGCPYNRDFESELSIIKEHEPKLYIAVNNIFGDSYEYTRKYKDYIKQCNENKTT